MILSGLFGNETAAKVLLFIENYGSGYPRTIAETYSIPVSQAQRQLERLEREGVLVSHLVGRTRVYQWNPRCFYLSDLRAILEKALKKIPEALQVKYFRQRSRPRRKGKPLP